MERVYTGAVGSVREGFQEGTRRKSGPPWEGLVGQDPVGKKRLFFQEAWVGEEWEKGGGGLSS